MASHGQLLRLGRLNDGWLHDRGVLGVAVFFAISGVLIGSRLLQEEARDGRISLRGFYVRRAFRILPAAMLYLLVAACLMAAGLYRPLPHWQGWWASLLFWRNFLPVLHTPVQGWITAHFWSLSLEEQFYLLLPGLLVLSRGRRVSTLVTLIVLLFAWGNFALYRMFLAGVPIVEARPDVALNVLFVPALAAVLLRSESVRGWIARLVRPWPLILLAIFLEQKVAGHLHGVVGAEFGYLGEHILAVLMTALVLSTALHPAGWLSRLLELAPLRWVGRISYGLYLWQQIFMTQHFAPGEGFGANAHHGLNWLLTFVCAATTYSMVERPLVRLGHRFTGQPLPGRP
jgi:peptidoglycan/LPS O-acetylase OafA/YrhL